MRIKGIARILLMALFIAPAYSATTSINDWYTKLKQGQTTVQFGIYSANQGTSQHVSIQGLIGDHYSITSGTKQNGLIGLGYFLPGNEFSRFNLFYGINAFYFIPNNVSGNVTQENLFTNLAYSYDISNLPIYAAAKALIKNNDDRYNIILDAGAGPNIIKTSHFKETSLDGGTTIPDNAFKGTTNTRFSATAGIGVRTNHLFEKILLECGYRIFYLGESELNAVNNQITTNLKTGNSYAQALVCGVTF